MNFIERIKEIRSILEATTGKKMTASFSDNFQCIEFSSKENGLYAIPIEKFINGKEIDVSNYLGNLNNKSVFIVFQGEYSDRHVVAACSTKKIAEKIISNVIGDDIEEYEIDIAADISEDYLPFEVVMTKDGHATNVIEGIIDSYEKEKCLRKEVFIDPDDNMVAFVFAKHRGHAVKIVNEFRSLVIANDQWKEGTIWIRDKLQS